MKNFALIAPELDRIIHDRFVGSVTLHCDEGQVLKYEVKATMKPGRNGTDAVDISEGSGAAAPDLRGIGGGVLSGKAPERRGLRK